MSLQTDFPNTNDCLELQSQLEKLLVKQDYLARNFLDADLEQLKPFLSAKKDLMKT